MNSIKTIIDACSHFSVYLPKRVTDLFGFFWGGGGLWFYCSGLGFSKVGYI